ncbi:spindle and kinetochore-associated protein 1-like [Prorops nasuta]|uniref:spindle and kinetochore-associated protein 1-like n=1 Tax=Prorops nasuta TaxID=863751 RepID=UPI0034CD51AC
MEETLEIILQRLLKTIHQLKINTAFVECEKAILHDELQLHNQLTDLSKGILYLKETLDIMKTQNLQLQEMHELLKVLKAKVNHMNDNVPPLITQNFNQSLVSDTVNYNNSSPYLNNDVDEQEPMLVNNCKKLMFDQPELFQQLRSLTQEEFNKVPKYIIGRQSLDSINKLIATINQVLKAKYSLLSLGRTGAKKKGDLDLFLKYKKQEHVCEDSSHFFTVEDYEYYIKSKLDKTKLNLIAALRHLKRLREQRKGKELYYVVMAH